MTWRDVAYGQIPRVERAAKHRETAEWIESLGRSEDHAELLAFHWGSALELAQAAGQDADDLALPTRLADRAAGDRTFAVNAYPSAATYYGDALALWPKDDEQWPQLLYRYADALFVANDERALSALEDARDALVAVGDHVGLALAEARSQAGECTQVEPGRYRARFVLGTDSAAYTGLACLLERVRHWRATDVYEGDEPVGGPPAQPRPGLRGPPAPSTIRTAALRREAACRSSTRKRQRSSTSVLQ